MLFRTTPQSAPVDAAGIVLVVVSASRRLDNKLVRNAIGTKKLTFVTPVSSEKGVVLVSCTHCHANLLYCFFFSFFFLFSFLLRLTFSLWRAAFLAPCRPLARRFGVSGATVITIDMVLFLLLLLLLLLDIYYNYCISRNSHVSSLAP